METMQSDRSLDYSESRAGSKAGVGPFEAVNKVLPCSAWLQWRDACVFAGQLAAAAAACRWSMFTHPRAGKRSWRCSKAIKLQCKFRIAALFSV